MQCGPGISKTDVDSDILDKSVTSLADLDLYCYSAPKHVHVLSYLTRLYTEFIHSPILNMGFINRGR